MFSRKNVPPVIRWVTRDTVWPPELTSVQNKSAADLLIAILDPNREAQPNFNTYTVVTENGLVFNGIIAAETANSITLKRAEAKQDVILRTNIEALAATGVSLMPEGLEKDLSPQDLADVIAFDPVDRAIRGVDHQKTVSGHGFRAGCRDRRPVSSTAGFPTANHRGTEHERHNARLP